jgi:hypothetical protein
MIVHCYKCGAAITVEPTVATMTVQSLTIQVKWWDQQIEHTCMRTPQDAS